MSMINIGSTTPSTLDDHQRTRLQWATALGRYSYNRRERLGLTLDRAAELSGVEVALWAAMEDFSWVPERLGDCQAIAATLEVCWSDFDLVALLARSARQHD
jgi:hypothetical protein